MCTQTKLTQSLRKSTIMNFNPDDPLGDLLSDETDDDASEDSFAKILRQPKPATAAAASNANAASKVSSLFGIPKTVTADVADKKPTTPQPSKPPSPIIKKPVPEPSANVAKPVPPKPLVRKEISFDVKDDTDDDGDIFADLGFDPKKPKGVGTAAGRKSGGGLLDDLLGIDSSNSSKPAAAATPATSLSKPTTPTATPPIINNNIRPTTAGRRATPFTEPIAPTTSTGRPTPTTTSRRNTDSAPNDPLGLFASKTPPPTQPSSRNVSQPVTRKNSAVNWMDFDTALAQPAEIETLQQPATVETPPTTIQIEAFPQPATTLQINPTTMDATTISLQQHETQLHIATQMRHQETAMLEMQRRQHSVLQQQELHFNTLLQQQQRRQTLLESNVRQQQERIQAHINALMQQPMPPPDADDHENPTNDPNASAAPTTLVELRVTIKRLEMENLRLADLCEHASENHDRELDLMATTHAKQVQLLTDAAEHTEKRLRDELTAQQEFYTAKLAQSAVDFIQTRETLEARLARQQADAVAARDQLVADHAVDIDQLRTDHAATVERIRQSRQLEQSVVHENTDYLDTLRQASGRLETASADLETVRQQLADRRSGLDDSVAVQLAVRERRVEQQLGDLQRQREATDAERTALLELVRTLETKLLTCGQRADEAEWSLRQQRAQLDAERAAFEKERAFARERAEREEKRAEVLRADQTAEYERQLRAVAEERAALLTEKAKVETRERLQLQQVTSASSMAASSAYASRAEIDAAVAVAQDAGRQCDAERERLLGAQRDCERLRRELIDRESGVRDKQTQLETQLQLAKTAERVAAGKLGACQELERKMMDRVHILQQRQRDLANRETTVAQERLDASRERLELQAVRRNLYRQRCSLCKIGARGQELEAMLTKSGVDFAEVVGQMPAMEASLDVDEMFDREVSDELAKMTDLGGAEKGRREGSVVRFVNGGTSFLDAELIMSRIDAMDDGGVYFNQTNE